MIIFYYYHNISVQSEVYKIVDSRFYTSNTTEQIHHWPLKHFGPGSSLPWWIKSVAQDQAQLIVLHGTAQHRPVKYVTLEVFEVCRDLCRCMN